MVFTESEPDVDDLTENHKLRHMSLTDSQGDVPQSFPFSDDERPKTRRVNPQRLALRLAPELVAEMEALIVPGAKMPTFAIRKDFQERYCVDRRHIYDYFHSRGLRVAKEDKHTNLKRVKVIKAEKALPPAPLIPASSLTEHLQDVTRHSSPETSRSCQEARAPKRAATYPNTRPPRRKKRTVTKRRTSMDQDTHSKVSASSPIHAISSPPTRIPPLESTSHILNGTNDAYWASDGSEVLGEGRFGQLIASGSLSTVGDPQDNDLMTPIGSSWALDQYNNLYDFPNEYYSDVHDTLLVAPYHVQDTLIHFPGYAPFDIQPDLVPVEKVETSLQHKFEN